jgi:hypothetical protein
MRSARHEKRSPNQLQREVYPPSINENPRKSETLTKTATKTEGEKMFEIVISRLGEKPAGGIVTNPEMDDKRKDVEIHRSRHETIEIDKVVAILYGINRTGRPRKGSAKASAA